MKFVSLLSGGKDSCYNVIKCIEHGHELVCLANLAPPEEFGGEDLNSFMYQTVGHTALPCMSECFGVPMIRQVINGTAVSQKLDYLKTVDNDEVEDLYLLLKKVKEQYPAIEGVSCGAIVSTYQRLRVESICQRLGLTVLSYLWMRDRVELLNEMVEAGVDAVLVKVAGAGLDPHKHLGKTLATLQPTLLRLHDQFGLDVCGEGGEYESLVLDCSVFKRRLQLQETEIVIDDENYTVGYLKINSCNSVAKSTEVETCHTSMSGNCEDERLLGTVTGTAARALQITRSVQSNTTDLQAQCITTVAPVCSSLPRVSILSSGFGQTSLIFPIPIIRIDHPLSAANNDGAVAPQEANDAVGTQLKGMFERLSAALAAVNVSLQDTIFVHLYIASSSIFKAVNDEYCKWFGHYPPSRSCVCAPLPMGMFVAMDATFLCSSHDKLLRDGRSVQRNVLHVKSMSEWAPLCIGPYAQANVIHNSIVYVAGQIPLNPATMGMFNPNAHPEFFAEDFRALISTECGGVVSVAVLKFVSNLALCLRHAHRVLQANNSSLARTLMCTVYVNTEVLSAESNEFLSDEQLKCIVRKLIVGMEAADADTSQENGASKGNVDDDSYDDEADAYDEEEIEQMNSKKSVMVRNIPVLIVGTSGLPRDAEVEVEVIGFVNNVISPRDFICVEDSDLTEYKEGNLGRGKVDVRDQDVTAMVDGWPLWHRNASTQGATPPSIKTCITRLPRSLCSGFVSVCPVYDVVADEKHVALDDLAEMLVLKLQCLLRDSGLHSNFLHSLRVYYQPHVISSGDLSLAIVSQLASVLGLVKIPLLLVPMVSLTAQPKCSASPILSVQLFGVDLAQLSTEEWIHVKDN